MKFKVFLAFVLVFGAAKSFTINCEYGNYSADQDSYACKATNISTTSGNRITAITGQHWSNKTDTDVNDIWILGNWTLSFFPLGFDDFFPNIKSITIWYSAFDTLYGDELDQFPKLEYINIAYSNLTTISSRLFNKTPKIISINFMFSSLERVGHDLLTSLNIKQVKWVNFSDNLCISRIATDQAGLIVLIDELWENCPFDDEEIVITTTTVTTTTSTTTALTTTIVNDSTCDEGKIEEFVCDLKEKFDKIDTNLTAVKEETKNELQNANEKIEEQEVELTQVRQELQMRDDKIEEMKSKFDDLQSKVSWLEEEIQRLHNGAIKSEINFILMIFVSLLIYLEI